jgi:hypothetical protein
MSSELTFKTLPWPGPSSYPQRIAVIGDLGMTYNSTSTLSHLRDNNPDLVLMVGDLSYANLYITNGTGSNDYGANFGNNTPIHESYQPRWDMWQRCVSSLMLPLIFLITFSWSLCYQPHWDMLQMSVTSLILPCVISYILLEHELPTSLGYVAEVSIQLNIDLHV